VAIPAYIAYSMLSGVFNRQIDRLETLAAELLTLLLPSKGKAL
jgi:biopolymer transport protein ExbB/TolQ